MTSGRVYKIKCVGTDECYIGSTRGSLELRLKKHISQSISPSRLRHTACNELICKYGSINVSIQLLEEMIDCKDQELWDRERYWIETTPACVNKNIPQPIETNQSTVEGKKAYMEDYRVKKCSEINQQRKEYLSNPEVRDHNNEVKREWVRKNAERLNAIKKERITCDKCKTQIPNSHKHEHTEEKCAINLVRRQDMMKAAELKEKGLSQREICKDSYFATRGYSPDNHDAIGRLLRNLKKNTD